MRTAKLHIGATTTQKHFGCEVSWPIRAQFSLGKMYYIGQGELRDNAKADAWYRKAADQGFDYAQFDLGVAYEDGGLSRRPWLCAVNAVDVGRPTLIKLRQVDAAR